MLIGFNQINRTRNLQLLLKRLTKALNLFCQKTFKLFETWVKDIMGLYNLGYGILKTEQIR